MHSAVTGFGSGKKQRVRFDGAPGLNPNTNPLEQVEVVLPRQDRLLAEEDNGEAEESTMISRQQQGPFRKREILGAYVASSPRATVMFCVIIIVAFTGVLGMIAGNIFCFITHRSSIQAHRNLTTIVDAFDVEDDRGEPKPLLNRDLGDSTPSSSDASDNKPHSSWSSSQHVHGGTVTITSTDIIHVTASDTLSSTSNRLETMHTGEDMTVSDQSTSIFTASSTDLQTTMSVTAPRPNSEVTYCPYTAHPDIYTPCASHQTSVSGSIVTSPAVSLRQHNPFGNIYQISLRRAVDYIERIYQTYRLGQQLRDHEHNLDNVLLRISHNQRDLQLLRRELERERRKLDALQLRLGDIKKLYDGFLEMHRRMITAKKDAMAADWAKTPRKQRRNRRGRDFGTVSA